MPEQILSTGIEILANDVAPMAVVAGENVSVTVAEVGGVTQYTVNADVPSVDTELSLYSPNPVANSAVTAALQAQELPSMTGQAGKVLAVNASETGTEWVAQSGGSGSSVINIGDVAFGMPVDPELWDKIAEPLFNGENPKIVATYGNRVTMEITAVCAYFADFVEYSQAATFADFKEWLETNQYTSYATFNLNGKLDGITFIGYAFYASGLQPLRMIGSPYNVSIDISTDNGGEKYLNPSIQVFDYSNDSTDWHTVNLAWEQNSGSGATDPGGIMFELGLRLVTGFLGGDIGNLSTATATNTIYTTDDVNESEALPCKIGIKKQTTLGPDGTTVVYTFSVRMNGLARECDSQGFPISGQPETPIMWLGQFEWQEKNGIYAYRCVSEQLSVLATV